VCAGREAGRRLQGASHWLWLGREVGELSDSMVAQVAVRSGAGERVELSEGYSFSRHEYPVNQKALENYLRHTGQESKLTLINPSLAKRIHSQASFVQGGHEHEPAMRSMRSYSLRALVPPYPPHLPNPIILAGENIAPPSAMPEHVNYA